MRAIVFANGELSHTEELRAYLRPDDLILCADGGAEHALTLGLTPHHVIGDFDSLSPSSIEKLEALNVRLARHAKEKNQTDLELTLDEARSSGAAEIVVVTALGDRLDQMLGNILLISNEKYSEISISLFDGTECAYLVREGIPRKIIGTPGDTLSLLPLTDIVRGLTTTGTQWNLTDASIARGDTLGISNRFESATASIEVREGMLLAVHRYLEK